MLNLLLQARLISLYFDTKNYAGALQLGKIDYLCCVELRKLLGNLHQLEGMEIWYQTPVGGPKQHWTHMSGWKGDVCVCCRAVLLEIRLIYDVWNSFSRHLIYNVWNSSFTHLIYDVWNSFSTHHVCDVWISFSTHLIYDVWNGFSTLPIYDVWNSFSYVKWTCIWNGAVDTMCRSW